jgi:hypothetical protein
MEPSRQALLGARPAMDPEQARRMEAIRQLIDEVGQMDAPRPYNIARMIGLGSGPAVGLKTDEQMTEDYRRGQMLRLLPERLGAVNENTTWHKDMDKLQPGLREEVEAYNKPEGWFTRNDYRREVASPGQPTWAGYNPIYNAARWVMSMPETVWRGAGVMGDRFGDAFGSAVYGKDYQPLPESVHRKGRDKFDYALNTLAGGMTEGTLTPLPGMGEDPVRMNHSYWRSLGDAQERAKHNLPGYNTDGSTNVNTTWKQFQPPVSRGRAIQAAANEMHKDIPGAASGMEYLHEERGVPSWLAAPLGLTGDIMFDPFQGMTKAAQLARQAKSFLPVGRGLHNQAMRGAAYELGTDVVPGTAEVWLPPVTEQIQNIRNLIYGQDR